MEVILTFYFLVGKPEYLERPVLLLPYCVRSPGSRLQYGSNQGSQPYIYLVTIKVVQATWEVPGRSLRTSHIGQPKQAPGQQIARTLDVKSQTRGTRAKPHHDNQNTPNCIEHNSEATRPLDVTRRGSHFSTKHIPTKQFGLYRAFR
jgi:hypothetical protein